MKVYQVYQDYQVYQVYQNEKTLVWPYDKPHMIFLLSKKSRKNLLLIRVCSSVLLRPRQDADLVYVHHQCSPAAHGRL